MAWTPVCSVCRGCITPVVPGPPLSSAGILLVHFSSYAEFSKGFLILFAALTILVFVLDYLVPVWGTKKFGGSKKGTCGSAIGMVPGLLFLPPAGLIIGPFTGS